ncbi:MAG TPA: beta-L-arabinofuranosidase domain-containing protein [Bryobacteraceae bacterium]|nr:beta-L-arabinofuranosidase domain-containing protein [Bryobacteraceae bacterium]
MKLNRRQFIAATAMAPFAARGAAARPAAQPFDLGSVRLLDSALLRMTERNSEFLQSLETDRLLHTFRRTAGLASSAEPLGGWEKPDIELRGHFTGHFLSACALMSASTGDPAPRGKGNLMVAELAKCQKANGNGYLSAFPPEFFDRLKATQKVWAPWYTLHKIMAGLLDMYALAGNRQALDVLQGMASWTKRWTDSLSDEEMARVLRVEFGGMNDVLCNLYGITGKKDYLEAAHRFDDEYIFGPLSGGRDELTGLHVNTQIPKIIGAARRYELTGDARYRRIAEFFWTQVTEHRSYATGGTSNDEHWRAGPDKLAGELGPSTEECCCTYNMLKLTRHLFAWSPEARYFDYYERAYFNGILGTMNPANGLTMYFVPLASGYWKVFASPRGSFWCCTGTGVETFSKLADSIYFHDENGVYVNLFITSELDWEEKGIRLRQDTGFPRQGETRLRIQTAKPLQLAIRVREPYWTGGRMSATVNGKAAEVRRAGGYQVVERFWSDGDELNVTLPMSLHVHPMPDDSTLEAIMYGPLVLAGDLGREGLSEAMRVGGDNPPELTKPVPAPEFTADPADPGSWIEADAKQPLTFRTKGQRRDITLAPLYRMLEQRYGVYWRVNGKQA